MWLLTLIVHHQLVLISMTSTSIGSESSHDFMYLAVAAATRLNPGRANGVDLVHEDDGGRVLPRHHKQLPHHPAALACKN